jgi:3-dehydroquinate synthase
MSEFQVISSRGNYRIQIKSGALKDLPASRAVLVDPNVYTQTSEKNVSVINIPGNEDSKTLGYCEKILVQMHNSGITKSDHVVAFGGGVVQDVATLVTSLYMRGIEWTYVPTTLMSMADSCIGGKSSINAGGMKNLIGNFYPPKQVLVDPVFIQTLSREAIVSGLAEAVKICFAKGPEEFERYISSSASIRPGNDDETAEMISHTLLCKKWFIEVDEFDQKERKLLNFGHSFGHAWEAACEFKIPHGVGVAVGVLAALNHPKSAKNASTIELEKYCNQILDSVSGSVAHARDNTDWKKFETALKSDKKNSRELIRLILPKSTGSVEVVDIELNEMNLRVARESIEAVLEGFGK